MSTLKQKAQDILDEKEEKIIPENIKKDIQIFDVTGTLEEGIDTSDATATENDLVADTTAYVNGVKLDGTLMDSREQSTIPYVGSAYYGTDYGTTSTVSFKLPQNTPDMVISSENEFLGYINNANFADSIGLAADIIKKGETILGITGTLEGSGTDTSDATATVNDIVEDTTAYVDGVKLNGNIVDGRTHNIGIGLDVEKIEDNSGTELVVDMKYTPDDSLKPDLVINSRTPLQVAVQYRDMVSELNITSDMIREGKEILGVTGTYSGSSIVYLEPGDKIHIHMSALQDALTDIIDPEVKSQTLAYDSENEDLFTLKLMDCVNLGQPYEHSGIGLVMNGTTTYLKIYNWDFSTDTNTLQSSDLIELVSGNYPAESQFTISELISLMTHLGGYSVTDLVFTYPSNAPIIPLIEDNTVKLLTKDGCDIGEVLTFNLPSSCITIEKAC